MISINRRFSGLCLFVVLFALSGLFFSACGGGTSSAGATTTSSKALTNVSIGLGYTPDIQFAPFYVAESKGYYQSAGLNVTLNHGIVTDLIGTMVAGKSTFVFAGGDELLEALDKNKSLQVTDVATVYQRYPVSLIVPANSSIKTLADIKGHSIGVPGPYGSTYTGLLALLHHANLSLSDVTMQSIGFNQVSALLTHKVDAVVGYSNNEPLQIASAGLPVRTFDVSDYQPLVSNGIIVLNAYNKSNPQVVKAFVQATLKGVSYVIAHPADAVTISASYVPGLNAAQASKVLNATIPIYKGDGHLGYNDPAIWQQTEALLVALKMISPAQNLTTYYTNSLLS